MVGSWRSWLIELPRYFKRAVLALIDFFLASAALWVALSIRYGQYFVPSSLGQLGLLLSGPLITLLVLWRIGLYRLVTRFIGYRGTLQIIAGVGFAVLVWSLLVFMVGQLGVPRSVILTYAALSAALLSLLRYAIGIVLDSAGIPYPASKPEIAPKSAIIYGAGPMGIALLQAMRRAGDRKVVAFVDTAPTMWRQYIGGLKVYAPSKLTRLIERESVREILVAVPEARPRRKILHELEQHPVEVKVLPAYEDIASGRVRLSDLRPVDVTDLLGRDPVEPNPELLRRNISGKAVLLTGAGGSIGSELVRQVLHLDPRLVVLLDVSEVALYQVELEVRDRLSEMQRTDRIPKVKAVLGSVLDEALISDVVRSNGIETIFHAAAYKHVPMVERNPISGVENNVFGTQALVNAALKHGVERMVLISTDKAVRPTNVMGASKRLSELILQAAASEQNRTVFAMVRFGNVLDSSGSVIRRFRQQIQAGGPITVTHPEVTRYFMSIPEAASLVIQAGAMANGGEVFVLDMGESVKIDKLARQLIRLSGLEVRDDTNPLGDIAISYIGLRPGEKLYEELLIGAQTSHTEHPRIQKSDEPFLPSSALGVELIDLKAALTARDGNAVRAILLRSVEGYEPHIEEPATALHPQEISAPLLP
ncbi:nucleoside-diphosphate sugar epimerase/dehydratase [Hyphomicrobium sp. LHD-15]|uniref:polysaccharide biosynthesis protein n=1 Tax=Hyphomicrobium sp. LHD-15 TaxID=3072142 RepID=UPI00280C7514|nr:nucleoside-diphosphate sugar epimerase/dehydratase [Hyphomicrobium sp. LHD-15]MDQ8699888.1 nucleoside-diphosphate sugar epimerase/dehydratase [Hyphomicrobium sp. LHD-15]